MYRYDPALPFYAHQSARGRCSSGEVMRLLAELDRDPEKLARRPAVIEELQRLTGLLATRKCGVFGAWQLDLGDCSVSHRPFDGDFVVSLAGETRQLQTLAEVAAALTAAAATQ